MKIKESYIKTKQNNMPGTVDLSEVYALIDRVAGKAYLDSILLEVCEYDGFDGYEISECSGKIAIRASSGSGFAAGFHAYLKERCGYSIGALNTAGTLPDKPPAVGEPIRRKSRFLYRFFFNYCTFSYTYAFDDWEDWEKTLDYLLLSGYNLILNPIGLEGVWRNTLLALGYSAKEADQFLCGPAFYAWQWMMNMSGWAGGAPAWWYEDRWELAGKINRRLQAFGVSVVAPGYAGMVPHDFSAHFPDAKLIEQGRWCGFDRPALLMPQDPVFDLVADIFYAESRKIPGAENIHYFSADPFHEGGITDGIDLYDYGTRVFGKMTQTDPGAVWVLQGWIETPKVEMVKSIPDDRVLVVNLSADQANEGELYGGAPWCYCAVYCFGGQYYLAGNAEQLLQKPYQCLDDANTNMIGLGYMPEGVNCNEIFYEIFAYNAFAEQSDLASFLSYYLTTRYGRCTDALLSAWIGYCRAVMDGQKQLSGESALCARPTLTVENTSLWAKKPNPYVDQRVILAFIDAMLAEYGHLCDNRAYCRDLMEAAHQAVANLSWYFVRELQTAFAKKDVDAVSHFGAEMLSLFDLQTAIVSTDRSMLLGTWLEKATRHGRTSAEKAYFAWNMRVQITLWANREGAEQLRDYSAREWQGLLEDYYRPRWESFISRLEIALLTDTPLEEIHYYDEELPFVYRKKAYPTTPSGDLKQAVLAALEKIRAVKVRYQSEMTKQSDIEDNVMKTVRN